MQKFSLLILCAGFGKRMLDLTADKPKPLLKVKNSSILSYKFFKTLDVIKFLLTLIIFIKK